MATFKLDKTTSDTGYHLHDRDLSLKARGLLSTMLARPAAWDGTSEGLETVCRESAHFIGAAVQDLAQAGYLTKRQFPGEYGHGDAVEYTVHARPGEGNT